jgi:hypothetical protein
MKSLAMEEEDAKQGCMCHDLDALNSDDCVHMGEAVEALNTKAHPT